MPVLFLYPLKTSENQRWISWWISLIKLVIVKALQERMMKNYPEKLEKLGRKISLI